MQHPLNVVVELYPAISLCQIGPAPDNPLNVQLCATSDRDQVLIGIGTAVARVNLAELARAIRVLQASQP